MQLFIKWIVEKKKKANIQSSACARWRLQILFILPPVQIAACCCSNATDGGKCVCVCVVAHRRQSAFFFLLRLPSKIIKKSSPLCIGRRDRRPGRRSEKSERERKGDDPLGGARPARPTNIIKKKKSKEKLEGGRRKCTFFRAGREPLVLFKKDPAQSISVGFAISVFFSLWNGPKSRNVVRETWDAWVSVCIIQSFFPVGSKRDTESSSLEEISWRNKPVAFFFVLAAKNAVSVARGSKYLHRFDYTETFGGKFKFLLTGSHYTARPLSLTVSTLFLFSYPTSQVAFRDTSGDSHSFFFGS